MYKNFLSLFILVFIPLLIYGQDMNNGSMDAKYKSVYKSVVKVLEGGSVDQLDSYCTPDMVEHDIDPMVTKNTGIAAVKDIFNNYHKIFPDMKAEIHNMAVNGDYLFAYITFTATTSQSFMGMPAHHKFTMNSVDLIRFNGDKMAEHWGFTSDSDMMNMMPQNKMMDKKMDKN
jgi:predicted ester cyclase